MEGERAVAAVVLDTNVWVAGFRSKTGASRRIIELGLDERLVRMYVSVPLAFEYEKVFVREQKQMGFEEGKAGALVQLICAESHPVEVHYLWRHQTPDPDDACVLEAAVAAPRGTSLVTFNERHFAEAASLGVRVETPGALLKRLRRKRHL